MLNRLTYKAKFHAIILLFFFLLLIVYKLNIKKTIALRQEYLEAKANSEEGLNAQGKLIDLERKMEEINAQLGSSISNADLHKKIIESILENKDINNITIWEFPKSYVFTDDDMAIYTNQLILNGDFKSLVKYLYLLETEAKISRIRSVNFKTKKIKGTINEKLFVEILLQNIDIKNR